METRKLNQVSVPAPAAPEPELCKEWLAGKKCPLTNPGTSAKCGNGPCEIDRTDERPASATPVVEKREWSLGEGYGKSQEIAQLIKKHIPDHNMDDCEYIASEILSLFSVPAPAPVVDGPCPACKGKEIVFHHGTSGGMVACPVCHGTGREGKGGVR